jgi:predicted permease
LDKLTQDIRFAGRQLRRQPAFALIAVATLGLGIGLNTAVFSLINALLFRPLPVVEEPERLVGVFTSDGGGPGVSSYMDFVDFRAEASSFAGLSAFRARDVDISTDGRTERLTGLLVTHDYFRTLGVRPVAGRFFLPEEDEVPGARAVAVLSYGSWQSRFGSDPRAIGGTLTLNGRVFTIVGVAPKRFRGTNLVTVPDIFVPMAMQPHLMPSSGLLLDRRGWGGISIVGRLAPGTALAEAGAEISLIGARLATQHASTNRGRTYSVSSFRDATLPPGVRRGLLGFSGMLVGLVMLVLLIACVNVANLTLARATRRRREMAVRQSLGASRSRIIQQLLTESALLASFGGLLAILLAIWANDLFILLPLPFLPEFGLDGRVFAFAAGGTALTAIAFGLGPALRGARLAPVSGLKGASGLLPGARIIRVNDGLVVAQVALSVAVLVGAGLFARSLINLRLQDPGFDPEHVLTATLDPSLQGYGGAQTKDFHAEVLARIRETPGVRSATITSHLPGPGEDRTSISIEGFQPPAGRRLGIQFSMVGTDYFGTLAIPLLRGRGFTAADREGVPPVIVVNEAAAAFFGDLTSRDALGARISIEGPSGPFMEIVGIVADARSGTLRQDPVPQMYFAWDQVPGDQTFAKMALLARVDGRPEAHTTALRSAVAGVDPNVPVMEVRSLDALLGDGIAPERLAMTITGAAGLLALLLASLGLYGVLSNAVSRRTAEIGIRMALGADRGHVLRRVMIRGLGLTGVGLAFGLAGAVAGSGALSAFLYGVSPRDVSTFVLVAGVLGMVAATASWIPARRATRVDPVVALRYE